MQKSYIISGILILLSVVLIKQQFNINDKPLARTEAQEYMNGLKLYNYNEQGVLKDFISAVSWKFIPQNRYSVIEQPNITIYKNLDYLYNITADSGNLMHKNLNDKIQLIKLRSKVVIKQQYLDSSKHKSGFTLNTSYLEFNPDTELATTNQQVTINKTGLLITGTGMHADLKQNQLELHQNVATKYNKQN